MGKICSNCNVEKELIEFHKFVHSNDGRKTICKLCISEKNKTDEVRKKINESKKIWVKNNKEKVKKYRKQNYIKHKNVILEKNKKRRSLNIEKYKELNKKYYEKNINKKSKEWREKNREKYLNVLKEWVTINYEKYIDQKRKYNKSERGLSKKRENYYKNKEKNKYVYAWRTILNNSVKQIGTKKEDKTIKLLGYSPKELKEHIENLFLEGMNWENRGEWHIDHIKPVSSFDKSEKLSIINSLDNLQPLWAKDNLKKSNKII